MEVHVQDTFIGSNSADYGGAIYSIKDKMIMDFNRVTFEDNRALKTSGWFAYGGGAIQLYWFGSAATDATKVTIRESTFRNNWAASDRGHHIMQIWNYDAGKGNTTFTTVNTKFTGSSNIFWGTDYKTSSGNENYFISPRTCSSSPAPCSVHPFVGTCTDDNKNGVYCSCAAGHIGGCALLEVSLRRPEQALQM